MTCFPKQTATEIKEKVFHFLRQRIKLEGGCSYAGCSRTGSHEEDEWNVSGSDTRCHTNCSVAAEQESRDTVRSERAALEKVREAEIR